MPALHFRRPRPFAVVALLAFLLALLPAVALAAPEGRPVERGSSGVSREAFDAFHVSCTTTTHVGTVHTHALLTGGQGLAQLLLWSPGDDPEVDAPRLGPGDEGPEDPRNEVVLDGDVLTVRTPVVDATGADAGSAVISLELTFGEEEKDRSRTHGGNRASHTEQTWRAVSGHGVAEVAGLSFPLTGCDGVHVQETSMSTNPRSLIISGDFEELDCTVVGEAGTLQLSVAEPTIEVRLTAPGQTEPWLSGFAHQHDSWGLADGWVSTPLHVYERAEDGQVLDDGHLELWVEPTGTTITSTLRFMNGAVRITTREIEATAGSLTLPVEGGDFDLRGCVGGVGTHRGQVSDPARPLRGTPLPSNDGPDGAVALGPASRRSRRAGPPRRQSMRRGASPTPTSPTTPCPQATRCGSRSWAPATGSRSTRLPASPTSCRSAASTTTTAC